MKNKKFYQNYVLKTEEEVLALMYLLFKDGINNYVGDMIGNFANEDLDDSYEFANSYLVTKELREKLYEWLETYEVNNSRHKLIEEFLKEKGMNEEKAIKVVIDLYAKMVGNSDFAELLSKDEKVFGSDVEWYSKDSLVKMFSEIAVRSK